MEEKIWCEKILLHIPKWECNRYSCDKWVGNGGICLAK